MIGTGLVGPDRAGSLKLARNPVQKLDKSQVREVGQMYLPGDPNESTTPLSNQYVFQPREIEVTLHATAYRGNKAALPTKPCVGCGLTMSWRRRWAKNWTEVKYCSDACRRNKAARG